MRRDLNFSATQTDFPNRDAAHAAPSAWGHRKFQRYVTPVALVYARLHRELEFDWWGQRIAAEQALFFDQSCAQTASSFTGRLVAGDEFSRLWLYFVPEQGLASAHALQQTIQSDHALNRMGLKIRIGVALGEANALTDTDNWARERPDTAQTDTPLNENSWNSGCYGIETAIRQAFRLCRVARLGEILASYEFMEALAGTEFYCAEQRIAGLDDESLRALVIKSKIDRALPAHRQGHGNIYDPMRDVRKNPAATRNAA